MAIGRGPRAAYRTEVNADAQDVVNGDDFDSSEGFRAERATSEREYARSLAEIERNPDACRQILESDDADSQLFHQILRDRRGIGGFFRGMWNRVRESAIGRTLGFAAGGMAVRNVVNSSLGLAGPVADILIGGGMGALSGYTRAKEQTEGAAVWMSELGILRASHGELDRVDSGQLMTALGIMRNAITDNRVRGNDATRFEMVLKYRQIKQLLGQRRNEARDSGEGMNPALSAIDQMMGESDDNFALVSQVAGEKYRKAYETVRDLNHNKVVMSTLKGFALGSTIGGVVGWMFNNGGLQGAADWVRNTFGGGENVAASQEALLQAKADTLAQSSQITGENATNLANTDVYNQVMSGDVDYNSLSEGNRAVVDHLSKLQSLADQGQDASISGLHAGELTQVNTILNGADPAQTLEQFANVHNIDMTVPLSNGQEFGEYLVANKEAFGALPESMQQFVLSHPSIAEQLVGFDGTPSAATALIDKLSGPLAIAGAGVGAVLWHKATVRQRNADNDVSKTIRGSINESRKEVNDFDREQLKGRQEALRSRLIGNRITILATAPGGIAALVPGARGSRQYDISGIDANGRLRFEDNDWDSAQRLTGVDPHPNLTLQQISNDNQTEMNPAVAVLAYNTPEALAAVKEARENNMNTSRERLKGCTAVFMPAFLAAPARAFPARALRPSGEFEITEVGPAPNEFLSFKNNAAENTAAAAGTPVVHPRIRLRDLITPDGLLNTPNPIRITKEKKATSTTTPEAPPLPDLAAIRTELGLPRPSEVGSLVYNPAGGVVFRFAIAPPPPARTEVLLKPGLNVPKLTPGSTLPGITATISDVELSGTRPVFIAEFAYTNATGSFAFRKTPSSASERSTLRTTLDSPTAVGKEILYIPTFGYLEFSGSTPGATPTTSTYEFTDAAGASQTLTTAQINMFEIHQFERAI